MIDPPAHAFTLAFSATPQHIDALDHVNNAVWVQWIQAVATSHWSAIASVADQASLVWVVTRHEIDYHRPLLNGGRVTAHSWVADATRGATFDRYIVFIGDDGVRHVSATTTWALIDRASGRLLRVRPQMIAQFLA